jgi:hypothetical protein
MTRIAPASLLLLFAAAISFVGCKKNEDIPALEGTWKLVSRDGCYCPAGPVPDETLILTATDFSFAKSGQVARQGTYTRGTAAKCGTTALLPVLSFSDASNVAPRNVPFSLNGQKLVLDYSNRCISDSPVDTYERLP